MSLKSLAVIQEVAEENRWQYKPIIGAGVSVFVRGTRRTYEVVCLWREPESVLSFSCGFPYRVSKRNQHKAYELVAFVNNRLPVGNFVFWAEDKVMTFQYGLQLDGSEVAPAQVLAIVRTATEACDRYQPPFVQVARTGVSVEEAFSTTTFDTQGGKQ